MASCLYRVKCVSESGFWNWIIWQSDVWDHLRVKCGHFLKGFKLAIAEEWDFHWLFMLLFWRTSEANKTKQKNLQKQTWMCLPQNFSFSYFSVWIPRIKSSKFHKKTFLFCFVLFVDSTVVAYLTLGLGLASQFITLSETKCFSSLSCPLMLLIGCHSQTKYMNSSCGLNFEMTVIRTSILTGVIQSWELGKRKIFKM